MALANLLKCLVEMDTRWRLHGKHNGAPILADSMEKVPQTALQAAGIVVGISFRAGCVIVISVQNCALVGIDSELENRSISEQRVETI